MNTNPIIYPWQGNIIKFDSFREESPKEESPKEIKYKKDGSPKNVKCNKKKGAKSEVYPFTLEDAKKMTEYFKSNEMWQCYLLFVFGINLARRIGDTISFTWGHLFNPKTGNIREYILEIQEEKTDKLANPRINLACRNAISLYISKTGVNPAENGYKNPVFIQTSGNFKGKVISADGYRKALKRAATAVGIEYNIGTHSTRKSFGMFTRMNHPTDCDSMELLQTILNHSDVKTTKRYIGITKEKIDTYYDDMGNFFLDYIEGDKPYTDVSNTPIVNLEANDLRDIITAAYKMGKENAEVIEPITHIEAINSIMAMIEHLKK